MGLEPCPTFHILHPTSHVSPLPIPFAIRTAGKSQQKGNPHPGSPGGFYSLTIATGCEKTRLGVEGWEREMTLGGAKASITRCPLLPVLRADGDGFLCVPQDRSHLQLGGCWGHAALL